MIRSFTLFAVLTLLTSTCLVAQNVAISNDGTPAHASAMLEVKSTGKGLLIPSMTTAQRTAIAGPANGLSVYDITTNSFWFYRNGVWTELSTSSSSWSLAGNAGTTAANFIGTTDAQPLRLRLNNVNAGQLQSAGSIYLGVNSGENNPTGLFNTAVGQEAMKMLTTGTQNVGIGYLALNNITTASGNVAVGSAALVNNTASNNTAVGVRSSFSNTTGTENVAIGLDALRGPTTSNNNIGIGNRTMEIGTGSYNIAIGTQGLRKVSGAGNIGVGYNTLSNLTTGNDNIAMGGALSSTTSGTYNIGIGTNAGVNNISGVFNIAIGKGALEANISSNSNTATGSLAINNSTGANNSAYGASAGQNNATELTGDANTFIGASTGYSAGAISNSTALGAGAIINASNQVRIGDANVTSIGGQVNWTALSDERAKRSIAADVPGLSFIKLLRPVTYFYSNAESNLINTQASIAYSPKSAIGKIRFSGFLAQEVEDASRKIGYAFSGVDAPQNPKDMYGLRYSDFIAPLVKAVQEQQLMIEELKKEIQLLKAQK